MSEPIELVLGRLETWLRANRPEAIVDRPPGVGETDLATAERALGRRLSADVRALYRWQNGAPLVDWDDEPGARSAAGVFWHNFAGGWLMPLESVAEQHPWFCSDRAAHRLIDQQYWWWRDEWVSIIDIDRGYICVDTAGAWDGPPGQLIEYGKHYDERPIRAASLSDWLAARLLDLEAGTVFDATGNFREDLEWRNPVGYPRYGDVRTVPAGPAPDEATVKAGPPDLAARAAQARPLPPGAPKTRRLLESRPQWGQSNGRWYIWWSEAAPPGKLGLMYFRPDTAQLWAEAKRIMDAAAAIDWDHRDDPDAPHRPYVELVY